MQVSGYDHHFRLEILKSAINAYNKMKEEEKENGKKIYRRRDWRRKERRKEREERKKTWYTKGGYDSVLFITATPNSKLRIQMQKEINKTDIRIKVVEKSGTKLVKQLQRNDPFKKKTCDNRDKCLGCSGQTQEAAERLEYHIKLIAQKNVNMCTLDKRDTMHIQGERNMKKTTKPKEKIVRYGNIVSISTTVNRDLSK